MSMLLEAISGIVLFRVLVFGVGYKLAIYLLSLYGRLDSLETIL